MKNKLIQTLTKLIRHKGYEGLSISHVSEATGLSKSSLYHHFSGGKAEMAYEVLLAAERSLSEQFSSKLSFSQSPKEQFCIALDILADFYHTGQSSCLLEIMSIDVCDDKIEKLLQNILSKLISIFSAIFLQSGVEQSVANQAATRTISLLQGSLVLSRVMKNNQLFLDQIADLKANFA